MWKRLHILRKPDDEGGSGGTATAAPAATPAAAPAAAAPAATPASAPAATPAASPAPAASAPAASPTAAPAPVESKTPENYWPADWRETVSKSDEKLLTRMQRYASPEAALAALVSAQNRIAAGELKPVLTKTSTPEQVKEFREAMGIPETADKYDLGKDFKIGDNEKALTTKLFEKAHGTNQTPEQVRSTMQAWREIQAEVAEKTAERDDAGKASAEDQLRTEWGTDFRKHINLINSMLDGVGPSALRDQVLEARLPDGTKFGNSPQVMQMLVGLALVGNPTGVIVPGGGADPVGGIREELGKIQKLRSTDRATYDKDVKMQERERELIDAAMKMGVMDEKGDWKKAA